MKSHFCHKMLQAVKLHRVCMGQVGGVKEGTGRGRYYLQVMDALEEAELEQIRFLRPCDFSNLS